MAESGGLFIIDAESPGESPYEFDSVSEEGSNTIAPDMDANSGNGDSTQGYKITFDGINDYAYGSYAFTEQTVLYIRTYIYIPTALEIGSWKELRVMNLKDGGAVQGNWGLESTGDATFAKWQLRWGATNQQTDTNFSLDTWHYVEIYFLQDGAAGGVRLYVDGDIVLSDLDQDTSSVAIDGIDVGSFSANGAPGPGDYFYIDDIKADTSQVGAYSGDAGISIVPFIMQQMRRRRS